MPEAGGELATYVNPYSVEELGTAIKHSAKADLEKINRQISKEYKSTSWEDSALTISEGISELTL